MKQNKSMKKTKKVLSSLLFFLCVSIMFFSRVFVFFNTQNTSAKNINFNRLNQSEDGFIFNIECDSKQFYFSEKDFNLKNLSNYQKEIRMSENILEWINSLINIGLTKEEAIKYIFPETQEILKKLKIAVEIKPLEDEVYVIQNSCEIKIEEGKSGKFLNEINFFEEFENCLKNGSKKIEFKISTERFNLPKIDKNVLSEKSCFSTNFETSSASRKNNIKVALSCFDGFVLEDGEVLSFNTVTGERNAAAGYKQAKIISGGTFTEGFGGGVCQVSTTLYNACLLSGLEILEVHNHSLPVSYIEPSFDAMVNIGSSDLVVRNNTGEKLIFTTSSKGDVCKVKIFGKPNEFKITRFSEKTKVIPAENEEVLTSAEKVLEFGVQAGEEKRISYAKDGFCSNGYLNYYDKKGNLIKTKKIRSNTYNPTRGVVVRNVG